MFILQLLPTLNNRLLRPIWFPQNCQNKFRKIKKKNIKVFARFSENMLYFCRPHPTSAVGANFCGCIFFGPCSEKNKKIVKKNKKFDFY
jgi:hypothetical protein